MHQRNFQNLELMENGKNSFNKIFTWEHRHLRGPSKYKAIISKIVVARCAVINSHSLKTHYCWHYRMLSGARRYVTWRDPDNAILLQLCEELRLQMPGRWDPHTHTYKIPISWWQPLPLKLKPDQTLFGTTFSQTQPCMKKLQIGTINIASKSW